MPSDAENPPHADPTLRSAQHRVRNDLQTLSALVRLSQRRATEPAALIEDISSWLNGLAAVYDALPIWDDRESVSVRGLVKALCGRCDFPVLFNVGTDDAPSVPAGASVAATIGLMGLLSYSANAARPGGVVNVSIRGGDKRVHVETVFSEREGANGTWPPFGLKMTGDALGAQYALGPEGDETVAVLVIPCR